MFLLELWGALNGVQIAWVYTFIILALIVVFINACVKTKNKIQELEARKTGIESEQKSGPSPILTAGLLCNACGMAALNSDSLSDMTKRGIMIIALALILVGVYKTVRTLVERQ